MHQRPKTLREARQLLHVVRDGHRVLLGRMSNLSQALLNERAARVHLTWKVKDLEGRLDRFRAAQKNKKNSRHAKKVRQLREMRRGLLEPLKELNAMNEKILILQAQQAQKDEKVTHQDQVLIEKKLGLEPSLESPGR